MPESSMDYPVLLFCNVLVLRSRTFSFRTLHHEHLVSSLTRHMMPYKTACNPATLLLCRQRIKLTSCYVLYSGRSHGPSPSRTLSQP
jgi:hypothetical protein